MSSTLSDISLNLFLKDNTKQMMDSNPVKENKVNSVKAKLYLKRKQLTDEQINANKSENEPKIICLLKGFKKDIMKEIIKSFDMNLVAI